MKKATLVATVALAAASVSALPALGHDHGHGQHESYSAGEPGDPAKPSRTIEIAMSEMDYNPFKIEVKRGEQIRFVLRNVGTADHEFLLATTKENLKHAEVMKKASAHGARRAERRARRAEENRRDRVEFTKPGTFEYSCLIPNHREYGMTGHVTVK
ncbi:plastocyanin/azurin family copper-binding protein [Bradyrhizobium sp. 18BD]